MRVTARRQIIEHPYNRCGCAVDHTVTLLRQEILPYARPGGWNVVQSLAEHIPDQLREVDLECGVNTQQFNTAIQKAIRERNYADLSEAMAGVDLEICGKSIGPRGVEIPFEELERAAQRQKLREEEAKGLR